MTRFKLERCGLISLFHYANQVFEAEDGHLLLRGSNGSGKSTAVELLIPLLLDGSLTASNLSTSEGQRSITYHLLLDGLYTRRLGYSWLQFARRDEDGSERWVTLALGVKTAQDSRHDAWFLVWDTPVMLDPHVMLVREDGAPLPRREAAKLPDVVVYDSAEEYRARVNQLLFGFSERRYDAMLRLMRRLRSAQLGKAINVAQTTELLELALPELDAGLLTGVGSKLDELEALRGELSALREADAAASRFVARYREFAAGVVARELAEADAVARAVRREAGKERRLAAARDEAADALEQAGRDSARVEQEIAHVEGELKALHASERWRAVEEIGAAQARAAEQADRARRAQDRAADLLGETAALAAELAEAESDLSAADRDVDAIGATLRDACDRAALSDLLQLPLEAAALDLLDGARRTRVAAVRRLSELRAAEALAREDAARRRSGLDALEAAERELHARRDELERERDDAQARLAEAVDAWAAGLGELRLEAPEHAALLRAAEEAGDRRNPLPSALEEPLLRATRRLAADEERHQARRRELHQRAADLHAQRDDLRAEKDTPPAPAPWRDPSQPGAPLWQLCDFADGLGDAERAGLERALEAAGLLDARVADDGALHAGHVIIDPAAAPAAASPPAAAPRTLADVLSAPAQLRPALACIAVADQGARGPLAVALDGTFALGPLRGKGADGAARFIGADARRAARERRIAELDAALADLDAQTRAVEQDLAGLTRRSEALQAERESLPAADEVAQAWERWRAAGRELEARRRELEDRRAAAKAAADRLAAAEREVAQHAAEHGLPDTPDGLAALDDGLARLTELLPEARSRLALRERLRATCQEREQRHRRGVERHEQASAEAAEEQRRAEELAGFAERLAAGAGAEREEVLADAAALEAELAQFARHRDELREQQRKQTGTMERLGAQRDAAAQERERLTRQQDERAARLAELDRAGLVELALGEPHAKPFDADSIAKLAKRAGTAPEVSTNTIYTEFDQLRAALDGSLGIEAVLDLAGDVAVVSAAYGGRHVPIAEAARELRAELERQQRTLDDHEERLFEEFLFGDVANELRARIADADQIAQAAARKISGVRTSSGIGVDLQWDLRPDLDPAVRNVISLLRKSDPRALPVEQRNTLMGFFRDRLAEAREASEHATLVDHLIQTLDYRRWFRFRIYQLKDGHRAELTRRTHSRDSGGEKSVTLHLPLLAAYHALLTGAEPHAPRLVALDEAFAGIDRAGQQQLLEVLDDGFDLDFVLTSEKLWCFEPQVHRLGVYQLRRFEGAPVAAVHWRWWGDQRRKEMVGLHAISDGSHSRAA